MTREHGEIERIRKNEERGVRDRARQPAQRVAAAVGLEKT